MTFIKNYLKETKIIIDQLNLEDINKIVQCITATRRKKGRIFFLGVGGSAGNASHAVNDFRKIIEIEAYAPTDNVSELTARTNDEGWSDIFVKWLEISNLNKKDLIFVFSVGGGDLDKNISVNLIKAINLAKKRGSKVLSILGRKDGYAAKNSDVSLIVPVKSKNLLTPFAEAYQGIVWHLLVSHPELKKKETKWESMIEKK